MSEEPNHEPTEPDFESKLEEEYLDKLEEEQGAKFQDQSLNKAENSKSKSKVLPNPLHDRVFVELREFREKRPEFVFWLRQINTNNRLNEGYWFQGTERYAHVGFYTANSGNYSTKSVGLVFWPIDKDKIGISLEVLYKAESNEQMLKFYDWMRSTLAQEFRGTYQQKSNKRFSIVLSESSEFDYLFNFLDEYKPRFDDQVRKLGLNKMFIKNDAFFRKLTKIEDIRKRLLAGEVVGEVSKDDEKELAEESEIGADYRNLSDLIYQKYHHISARDMRPVIGAKELALEMSVFLSNLKGDSPMLVGLFGRWGRGKTFLFNLIWDNDNTQKNFYRVDYHAWKHQKTPASWGYLYEEIAKEYYNQAEGRLKWFKRRRLAFGLNIKRKGSWELLLFASVILVSAATFFWDSVWENLWAVLGGMLVLGVSGSLKLMKLWEQHSTKASDLYKKYTQKHSYSDLLGVQAEVQEELKHLLEHWIKVDDEANEAQGRRVLLFVDDIDRCSEDRIIEVVDALRVMLEDSEIAKRVIVVAAIDERILRRAVRLKYDKLLPENEEEREDKLNKLTREYLDKLFIAGIKLGDLSSKERAEIFGSITDGKVERIEGLQKEHLANSSSSTEESKSQSVPEPSEEEKSSSKESNSSSEQRSTSLGENEQKFEISKNEEQLLIETIEGIKDITPRQIRIFYLRYLLGRDFLKNVKKYNFWSEKDVKTLLSLMAYLNGRDLIDNSVTNIFNEAKEPHLFQRDLWDLDKTKREDFIDTLETVIPY